MSQRSRVRLPSGANINFLRILSTSYTPHKTREKGMEKTRQDWTGAVQEELQYWFRRTDAEAHAHLRASIRNGIWWRVFSLSLAMLSVGATAFGVISDRSSTKEAWVTYGIIGMTAASGFLSSVQGIFNLSENPPLHKSAFIALSGLAADVRRQLALPPDTREAASTFIAKVQQRYTDIAQSHPVVNVPIKTIDRGLRCPVFGNDREGLSLATDAVATDIESGHGQGPALLHCQQQSGCAVSI